jgi:polygalacturonase
MGTFNLLEFGARGDGAANDAAAIQKAIDRCTEAGGGTVLVPAGRTFLTSRIVLRSRVNLHLEPGAVLASTDGRDDFPNQTVIEAWDAEDVSITGTGTVDGRAHRFMLAELPHIYRGCDWRPHLIRLVGCRKVTIRDVTLRNAAQWALTPIGCDGVLVHGITIDNDLKVPNGDGIDPENCRHVRISDCHIAAGDDAICLKSSREWMKYGPCEAVTVTGCTLVSTSCAIKIGSGVWTSVRDCVFDSCVIRRSHRGLGIQHRDAGSVENLLFSNMVIETRLFHDDWWGRSEPIYVTALPREAGKPVGPVRNIRFRNLLCRGESGIYVCGSPESVPEGLSFEGVRVEIDKTSRHAGGRYDNRPGTGGLYEHRTAGVYVQRAKRVTLRNVEVVWGANRPDSCGPALECHAVEGLEVEEFRGEAAHPDREPARVATDSPEG